MEVFQNFTDRSCAFKGKRTKRSRPSSPLDITAMTTVTTTSSSTGGGSDDGGRGGGGGRGDFYNSPTTSTTQISTTSTSEEDEDMANCLILLAQSGCGQKVPQVVTELKKEKISSRKFAEMTTSTTGKAGFYVYECKTCNRTFPSFQALGGHRASHKKPKTIVEEKKFVTVNTTDTDTASAAAHDDELHHQGNDQEQGRLNKISISHSTQIVVNNNKTKIHECSICGSEFSSGQALGGHMRRHRPPTTTTTTTTTAATTNTKISTNIETTTSCNNVSKSWSSHHDGKSTRNILSLDLNLPAPSEEDDHKFEQSLVFSAAPLVDCYY